MEARVARATTCDTMCCVSRCELNIHELSAPAGRQIRCGVRVKNVLSERGDSRENRVQVELEGIAQYP